MTGSAHLRELDALIEDLTVDAYGDEDQLSGFLVGAEEALQHGESAQIVGVDVSIIGVDTGPDARTGLIARVRRDGAIHEIALADLRFAAGSVLGLVVAAYRRCRGATRNGRRGRFRGSAHASVVSVRGERAAPNLLTSYPSLWCSRHNRI